MQAAGKGLNTKEQDKDINKLMTKLSPFGIGIRKDAKGNYEYYQESTGQTKTEKEVNKILKKEKDAQDAVQEETTNLKE